MTNIPLTEITDPAVFPLDTPVLVTNVLAAMGKAGKTGTLYRALEAIAAQTKPLTIVVRVAEGETEADTTSNVVGGVSPDGKYLGVKALLAAQSRLGVKPRILGAPGLDTKAVTNALASVAQQLRAFVYASAYGCSNVVAATTYRGQFGQRTLDLVLNQTRHWPRTHLHIVTSRRQPATCSVTKAFSTPLISMRFITSREKCRPAAGAATAPMFSAKMVW